MAKKSSSSSSFGLGSFGTKSPKRSTPAKQEEPPAPRSYEKERVFCEANEKRLLVAFRYDGDAFLRAFGPDAVYRSTKDKVLVEGILVENPGDPRENGKVHTFEVGKVRWIELTNRSFIPNKIGRSEERYRHIICPMD
jgi:hypothetical protein